MKTTILILLNILFLSLAHAGSEVDKTEKLNGVSLKSGKQKAVRSFVGSTERILPFPIDLVKKGVTNFDEKCNNSYKSKRKFTSSKVDCKYHNENLVESFLVKDIRKTKYFQGVSEFYLIGRQVYNRGSFGYYELVTVREGMNDQKQKTLTILLRMLDDSEVRVFTTPKFTKESAFDTSTATYVLTALSPGQTKLQYEYSAETDHWLLNKEVSVPQVFASISRSINALVKTVETESSLQTRELASQD